MASNPIYPNTSPYKDTGIFNQQFLDVWEGKNIPSQPSDVLYQLPMVYQYRPDLLAHDLYGDSRLWWVFAARNPNKLSYDPYFDFVTGIEIYIPKMETLRQALGI